LIKHIFASAISANGKPSRAIVENSSQAIDFTKGSRLSWLNFIIGDISLGLESVYSEMKLTITPSTLLSGYLSNYEDKSDILGLMLPILRVEKGEVNTTPLIIYLSKNRLISIHDEYTEHLLRFSKYSDTFMQKLPIGGDWQDPQTFLLARVIDEVAERNFKSLHSIIEQAELIQLEIANSKTSTKKLSLEIFNIKQSVLTFLNAVWAIRDVVHSLRYGDSDMISDNSDVLVKFDIILGDLDRQLSMAEHVLEVLAGGMSVLQTMFQANLQSVSNRMTTVLLWLTIVGTAILLPNTLATIYGIPFLPLDTAGKNWIWIILSLIVSTIFGTMLVYYFARKIWSPINEGNVNIE
jgi:magnesium transporter|tara:strand:+ start:1123 stop:2178 length:1056 start_codon:yes stop_codon:yes gene_type:complete